MKMRYVPNLQKMAAQCEANYVRLLKLLPAGARERRFAIAHLDNTSQVVLKIEKEHPYTTELLIQQQAGAHPWLMQQSLQVRMYHDANMAEVLSYQQHDVKEGRYSYPNPQMYSADEKAQLNEYLADWLSHCLRYGVVAEKVR